MTGTIETPPEYWRYVVRDFFRQFPRRWLRYSLFSFVPLLCFLLVIHFKLAVPARTIIPLALAPFAVSAGMLVMILLLLLVIEHRRWKWDDEGIRISLFRHRWAAFQRFRIDSIPALPGVVSFRIQCRSLSPGKGVWIAIAGSARDAERLAECAREHGVPESAGVTFKLPFP
jgi:hypothetical protein